MVPISYRVGGGGGGGGGDSDAGSAFDRHRRESNDYASISEWPLPNPPSGSSYVGLDSPEMNAHGGYETRDDGFPPQQSQHQGCRQSFIQHPGEQCFDATGSVCGAKPAQTELVVARYFEVGSGERRGCKPDGKPGGPQHGYIHSYSQYPACAAPVIGQEVGGGGDGEADARYSN